VDDIDERIVVALIRDARASYATVGHEVGLSAPAVKRRVDRLLAAGAITGFSARVDPVAMGWTTEAYVELFCGGRTSPDEIAAAVRGIPRWSTRAPSPARQTPWSTSGPPTSGTSRT
jgi:DNA-binding Lrp family transcriptional regulator